MPDFASNLPCHESFGRKHAHIVERLSSPLSFATVLAASSLCLLLLPSPSFLLPPEQTQAKDTVLPDDVREPLAPLAPVEIHRAKKLRSGTAGGTPHRMELPIYATSALPSACIFIHTLIPLSPYIDSLPPPPFSPDRRAAGV
jgi:hypothetical protein